MSDSLSLSVIHARCVNSSLTGSPADLISGQTRILTATIYDLNNNVVTSGPDSTLSIAFAKTNIGGGSVTGTGSASAVAGVATKTLNRDTTRLDTSHTGNCTTSDSLSFTVVLSRADHINRTVHTFPTRRSSDLILTATIYDLNNNVVTSGPDSTLSIAFAKTNIGGGSVTGTGSASAVAGVATKT